MTQNSYLVLARKYRPQNFDELVGQEVLVTTLSNAIKNNRLHHAYILTGIRGVGKTTTARIIAKTLNCLNKEIAALASACGICANCLAISASKHQDVIEIDAASRTGVDDIREILYDDADANKNDELTLLPVDISLNTDIMQPIAYSLNLGLNVIYMSYYGFVWASILYVWYIAATQK